MQRAAKMFDKGELHCNLTHTHARTHAHAHTHTHTHTQTHTHKHTHTHTHIHTSINLKGQAFNVLGGSYHSKTNKMWYSSFVKLSVRPGSQYDAGTVNIERCEH